MTKYYRKHYPRPQFVRESFQMLDGEWNFRFDDNKIGSREGWQLGFTDRKIRIPFSYECKSSGIGTEELHETVWYSRKIDFSPLYDSSPEEQTRILLNFESVDYRTTLWVNGNLAGIHEGGYTRFTFDITDFLQKHTGTLVVRVDDSARTTQPRGKQRWMKDNFDCWYVQTTGIWKSVWAERVDTFHLSQLHMIPLYDDNAVDIVYELAGYCDDTEQRLELETEISFQGEVVCQQTVRVTRSCMRQQISLLSDSVKWKVKYWCPKSPNLYDVCVRIYRDGIVTDEVGCYFGLRKISTDSGRIKLNNMDCYLRMVLDQGYWPDSMLTPPDEEALIRDLDKILAYGYNGVRKHQKIEDERFYYWADVKGLLVWCEAPSHYELNEQAVQNLTREWTEIVRQLYNHPSIITWVPFNESWGISRIIEDPCAQHLTEGIYHLTKTLDPSRPVICNDGWEHTISDIISIHDYASDGKTLLAHWKNPEDNLTNRKAFNRERYLFAKGFSYTGQPIVLSEFGGIAYGKETNGWGYGETETRESDFLNRLEGLVIAIKEMSFLSGFCYTQLTDVQQEQNGHMYMNRKDKVIPENIKHIITF